MIAFQCLGCGQQYTVKDEFAGRPFKCRQCKSATLIPNTQELSEADLHQPTFNAASPTILGSPIVHGAAAACRLIDLIFDFRFQRYLTPWIVRAWWALLVINLALVLLVYSFSDGLEAAGWHRTTHYQAASTAPNSPPNEFLVWLGWSYLRVLSTVAVLMLARVLLETAIVLFNIANDIKILRRKGEATP
jgi:hypothetical protein